MKLDFRQQTPSVAVTLALALVSMTPDARPQGTEPLDADAVVLQLRGLPAELYTGPHEPFVQSRARALFTSSTAPGRDQEAAYLQSVVCAWERHRACAGSGTSEYGREREEQFRVGFVRLER
jgi:hypothetical protein